VVYRRVVVRSCSGVQGSCCDGRGVVVVHRELL